MANLTRTPCFVATMGLNDYVDLHSGMRWLMSTIVSNYRKIHNQNEYFLSFAESTEGAHQRKDSLTTARSLTGRRTRVRHLYMYVADDAITFFVGHTITIIIQYVFVLEAIRCKWTTTTSNGPTHYYSVEKRSQSDPNRECTTRRRFVW